MPEPFILGWEEWLSLPDLGLPAIKAKVDTGARTSALHAFLVEPFGPADQPKVRFGVHPIPGRDDVEVICSADIVDRRDVTSSNGDSETRYVIRSDVAMGERRWPIEITLANRETMAYRMLLGRQAIQDDMFVDAGASFRQPRLGYKVYRAPVREAEVLRALSLALMSRRPETPSNRRLVRAAESRGHRVVILDRTRLSLYIDAREPALFLEGRPLIGVDAVIVRAGRTLNSLSLAAVRQLETLGAYAINGADALARALDPLALRQILARAGIAVPEAAVSHADLIKAGRGDGHVLADSLGTLGDGPILRFAVVAGRGVVGREREALSRLDSEPEWRTVDGDGPDIQAARQLAEAAARTAGLGLVAVDLVRTRQGPIVIDLTTNVPVAQIERISGAALAEAVIVALEQEARGRAGRA